MRYKRHIQAENGGKGGKPESTGKQGADHFIEVPLGAVSYDQHTNE